MAKNYVQPGNVLDHTAAANLVSGQAVLVGKRLGVALTDIANGSQGPVSVEGVWSLPKKAGDTPAQGDLLYWSAADSALTTTASGNTLAGYAFAAAGGAATSVLIKING